jgi:hypothetical protein
VISVVQANVRDNFLRSEVSFSDVSTMDVLGTSYVTDFDELISNRGK